MLTRPVAVLIRNQVVLALPPDATVRTACQRMRERYVGSVVVADERNHLLGIFTERDAVCRVLAEGRDADHTTVAKVMTTEVATVAPQATALEALRLMQDGGFRHVPVVAAGRVVGIVSYTDFRGQEHERLEHETELFQTIR
jgi:CBS domain-containing protein